MKDFQLTKKISAFFVFLILFSNLFSQTNLNSRFAINFPFRNPETASFKTYFNLLQGLKIKVIRQLTFGDVFWKEVEATNNNWTFSKADSGVGNQFGITPIPTLYSMFGEDTVGFQVPWKASKNPSTSWKASLDSIDTKDYLSTVIKRYKNKTKYWEVGNELSVHDRGPAGFSAVNLVDFLKLNYKWIKEIDPQAIVVLPGILGTCNVPFSGMLTWLKAFLKAGGGTTFDIMNYHDYNSWWTLPFHLDSIKTIMKQYGIEKKIWVTECSISSDNTTNITPAYSSPDEQVADTWRRPCVTFGLGLDLYFWHSLWSSGGASEWRHFGLTDHLGKKKKSFHSYRLFIEKLDNFTSVEKISAGTINDNNNSGGEGLWVYKFTAADGSKKYVLWAKPNQTYEITGLTKSKATLTSVLPASITIDGESVTWNMTQKDISGGKVSISLTNMPILFEEGKIGNNAPISPSLAAPANNSVNTDYNVNLVWNCSDPDGDSLKYNIYLDQNNPPSAKIGSNITKNSYMHPALKKNTPYYWKIVAKDGTDSTQSPIWKFTTGQTSGIENKSNVPIKFELFQNFPNPFNPSTVISYQLPAVSGQQSALSRVTLKIYDVLGMEVSTLVNEDQPAGKYSVEFRVHSAQYSSGLYFCQLKAGSFIETKKMMLLK